MVTKVSRVRVRIPKGQVKEFCQRYQVRRLALFGSALRPDFGAKSDVDVLVLFAPEARVGLLTLSRMQRELSGIFERPVDLVLMDGLKPVIRDAVLSEAKEVYAA